MIGDKAHWKGNLKSPAVAIHEQAVIEGGYFEVPGDSLGGPLCRRWVTNRIPDLNPGPRLGHSLI